MCSAAARMVASKQARSGTAVVCIRSIACKLLAKTLERGEGGRVRGQPRPQNDSSAANVGSHAKVTRRYVMLLEESVKLRNITQ